MLTPLTGVVLFSDGCNNLSRAMEIVTSGRDLARLQRTLLHWFDACQRDLPWRHTRDPYAIWVAEIMLQQTRVAAVLEHYEEFLQQFPSLESLAQARRSRVLAAWSGLGYYRRARALHEAARKVCRELGGRIPETEQALVRLPGVGRYTAAAIASTAFGQPCAVVDGNVERVLQRLLGNARARGARLWAVAEQLLSRLRPGDFNQAMMELGALLCLPASPRCQACPLRSWCASHGPLPKLNQETRRKRRIGYLLATTESRVFLVKRSREASLMPGMWELPPASVGGGRQHGGPEMVLRHSITNADYTVSVVGGRAPAGEKGRWVRRTRLKELPLTGLTRKIMRRAKII